MSLAERPLRCWAGALALYALLVGLRLPPPFFEDFAAGMLRFSLSGLSAFLLLLPAVLASAPRPELRPLDHPALAFLGVISYGIYLWHTIVISGLAELGVALQFAPLLALTAPVTLVIAFVSHRALEARVLAAARSGAAPRPVRRPALLPSTTGRW